MSTHITRSGSFTLPWPPARAFEHFTPEGERAWAPGWEPEYLHQTDAMAGTVFRTNAGGEAVVWLVARFDAVKHEAIYVRTVEGSRTGFVSVKCRPEGSSTRVDVTYDLTALSPHGEQKLSEMTEESYAAMMKEWQRLITA